MSGAAPALPPGLSRKRALARAALWFEQIWPAVWPVLGVAGAFVCLALLDVLPRLPPWPHLVVLLAFALALIALIVRARRMLRAPGLSEADRRLEQASGLKHRPLATLADRPAQGGGTQGGVLWQAHLARARAQIARLRVGLPHPGLARHDPRALRGLLVVALAALLVIAGGDAPSRLARAFQPQFPPPVPTPTPQLQAWVTPPAYTGIAPIFLKPGVASVSVPAGSHLTANVTGITQQPTLALGDRTVPFRALDHTSFQADASLTASGKLSVQRKGDEMAGWTLTVVPDKPPSVVFNGEPGRDGNSLRVRVPWRAADDYGVTRLAAHIRLRDRPNAKPLEIPVAIAGDARKPHGVARLDLTASPWAGLPVMLTLVAHDAANQAGTSDVAFLTLPERAFRHPIARALVIVRQMLALRPDDRGAAIRELDRLSNRPRAFGGDLGAYLNLRAVTSLLAEDQDPGTVDRAQKRLWELALHLEEGGAERTARALATARDQLRDALDRQKHGGDVSQRDIDRLMQKFQQALAQHLQALTEQAKRDGAVLPNNPNAQTMTAEQLQRMAQQMADAAKAGHMDEARQEMKALEQMLKRLQAAKPAQRNRHAVQQQRKGKQEMSALQDIVRRQAKLLDNLQERSPAQPQQDQLLQPGAHPWPGQQSQQQSGAPSAQQQSDARVEEALRRALGELMQQFSDLTSKLPPSLGEADKAMRNAGLALGTGHDDAAAQAEQQAIEALQKGGQDMGQQMAKMRQQQNGDQAEDEGQGDEGDSFGLNNGDGQRGQGKGQGQGENQNGQMRHRNANLDPLGRSLHEGGSGGTDDGSDVRVPDKMEQARSRELQDELRKRGADRDRPQEELDYINRLLKQF